MVTEFLAALSGGLSRSGTDVAERSEKLARITLENIGPYDHLTRDLDPGWNVLLGDNGVGESTILKAIALVYAGDGRVDPSGSTPAPDGRSTQSCCARRRV